ncbi:alpha/beta hydrolase [Kribbella sp. NPDC051587]|uniref:alpha/beta hydrolase n=1 Tax=Kribbella sp. NPDC051587 TaxID=3364119 RepID=UPI0037A051CD
MQPGVDLLHNPAGATDLVLLAHGGYEHSHKNPGLWRGPILRMWPFAEAARTAVPSAAVGLVRYRYRGWNDVGDPALDLRAILDELPFERVVLVGHSMGGRAVVAAGDHPRVTGVLGLAPWLPSDEPLIALRPPVMFAHGNKDTVTSPQETRAYANRLRAAGTPVSLVFLAGETHPMLHRPADWNTLVTTFTQHALAGGDLADGDREWPQTGAGGSMIGAVLRLALTRLRLPVRHRFRITHPAPKANRPHP